MKLKPVVWAAVAAVWLVAALPATGADVVINEQFTASAGNSQYNGSAFWSAADKLVLVTTAGPNQAGSAWYKDAFDFSKYESFRASFDLFLGSNPNGGDGATFAVIDAANGLGALGGIGGWLGYGGSTAIPKSFAVEFDTSGNGIDPPLFNDPNANHLAIDVNGSVASALVDQTIPLLEDGKFHNVTIDFTVATGTIDVRLDGKTYISGFAIPGFNPNISYYCGFTAGTGAVFNDQKVDSFFLKLT